VGEFAGASAGLGYMIQFASTQMETSLVFAALIQISVLGMFFYYAIEFIEWKYISWAPKL
jgi:NitT/TauT family transport system permease protein